MKKYTLSLLLSLLAFASQAQAQILITGFGSNDTNPFNTSTDFLAPWTGTQTTSSISVSGVSNQSGGIYSVLGTPINISGSTATLQLTGALSGTAPVSDQFQITLYDSSFNSLSYNFDWSTFAGGTQTVTVPFVPADNVGVFSGTVASYGLSLFGAPGDTVSFTFANLQTAPAAPEPSTFALLGLGLGFIGFCLHRRQKTTSVL